VGIGKLGEHMEHCIHKELDSIYYVVHCNRGNIVSNFGVDIPYKFIAVVLVCTYV